MPSYMNKNVNLFLLGMVVIVVITIVGGTIFYGNRFSNITSDYNELVKEVKSLNEELTRYKHEYNYSLISLKQIEDEQENLKSVYTTTTDELKGDVNSINSTLLLTRNNLENTKNILSETEGQLTDIKEQLTLTKTQLNDKTSQYNNMKDDRNQYQDLYEQCSSG